MRAEVRAKADFRAGAMLGHSTMNNDRDMSQFPADLSGQISDDDDYVSLPNLY